MSAFGIGGSSSKSTTTPWGPQAKYLKDVFGQAQSLYRTGPYQGDYTAGIQPWQTQAAGAGADLFGEAQQTAGVFGQYGGRLAGGLDDAASFYRDTLAGGNGFRNPMQEIDFGRAAEFADNPYIDQQITAALRDPYRDLTENVLPGNAVDAIATGNSGSSRRMMGDAIARRGYEDRAADVGAGFRGAAYDRGLDYAQDFASQSAFYDAQGQDRDLQARFRAGAGSEGLGRAGLGYLGDSYDLAQAGAGNLAGWGDYLQGLDQDQITGAREKWGAPLDLLNAYSSIIQQGNWGGTTRGKSGSFGLSFGGS